VRNADDGFPAEAAVAKLFEHKRPPRRGHKIAAPLGFIAVAVWRNCDVRAVTEHSPTLAHAAGTAPGRGGGGIMSQCLNNTLAVILLRVMG
jgi:hypothetical protein